MSTISKRKSFNALSPREQGQHSVPEMLHVLCTDLDISCTKWMLISCLPTSPQAFRCSVMNYTAMRASPKAFHFQRAGRAKAKFPETSGIWRAWIQKDRFQRGPEAEWPTVWERLFHVRTPIDEHNLHAALWANKSCSVLIWDFRLWARVSVSKTVFLEENGIIHVCS